MPDRDFNVIAMRDITRRAEVISRLQNYNKILYFLKIAALFIDLFLSLLYNIDIINFIFCFGRYKK